MISRRARANRFADSDLPRPLRHRHQHDVHDPDPADQQRDERDDDQHDRQRHRNILGRAQDCRQRPHFVFRFGRMPAP